MALVVAIAVTGGRPATVQASDAIPLAVLAFEDLTQDPQLATLARGLSEILATDLAASDELQLLERSQLDKVFAELKLQRTARFDPQTAAKVGKTIGAALVAVGSYQRRARSCESICASWT